MRAPQGDTGSEPMHSSQLTLPNESTRRCFRSCESRDPLLECRCCSGCRPSTPATCPSATTHRPHRRQKGPTENSGLCLKLRIRRGTVIALRRNTAHTRESTKLDSGNIVRSIILNNFAIGNRVVCSGKTVNHSLKLRVWGEKHRWIESCRIECELGTRLDDDVQAVAHLRGGLFRLRTCREPWARVSVQPGPVGLGGDILRDGTSHRVTHELRRSRCDDCMVRNAVNSAIAKRIGVRVAKCEVEANNPASNTKACALDSIKANPDANSTRKARVRPACRSRKERGEQHICHTSVSQSASTATQLNSQTPNTVESGPTKRKWSSSKFGSQHTTTRGK
jgi:hypothetical protein